MTQMTMMKKTQITQMLQTMKMKKTQNKIFKLPNIEVDEVILQDVEYKEINYTQDEINEFLKKLRINPTNFFKDK